MKQVNLSIKCAQAVYFQRTRAFIRYTYSLAHTFFENIKQINKTSLDFNYVKPCFDLLQFKYTFITLGQKDFLIKIDLFNFIY